MGRDTAPSTPAVPLLSARGAAKSFGVVEALCGADIDVFAGEIVALVGESGAGKSSLAKALSGALTLDAGIVRVDGREVRLTSPADALDHGIATVFQDVSVCENLSVAANIFLGREPRRRGLLDESAMEARSRRVLLDIDADIASPKVPLAALTGGQRQLVAIARALISHPRVVVLDEPTVQLSQLQTAEVLTTIQRLRSLGLGVLLISHSTHDVRSVADRIVVLRHGRNNGTFSADTPEEVVLAAITGAGMAHLT